MAKGVVHVASGSWRDRSWLLLAIVPAILWVALLLSAAGTFWSLVYDDSFYYWQIGRNLATGHGSSFDGIHPTNGYHPLWMLFCAGLYALGLSGEAAPLTALLAQVLLFAGAWLLLGRSVLRLLREAPPTRRAGLIEGTTLGVLLVLACTQPVLRIWVNGLESAFVLVSHVLLLGILLRTEDLLSAAARRERLFAAVLITAAVLSRTDGALLMPAVVVWALPRLVRSFRSAVVPLLELLLLPGAVTAAYMAINQFWFGSAVQVSGLLKAAPLSALRVLGALLVVVVPAMLARRLNRSRWPRLGLALSRTKFFGLFCLVLLAYYGFLQEFQRLWYFGPPLLLAIVLANCALADMIAALAEAQRPGQGFTHSPVTLVAIVAVGMPVLLWLSVQQVMTPGGSSMLAAREAGRFVATTLPRDAVLASWDAGVLGYYADRPVVNLDGVVNSVGYLQAMRSGTTAAYLADVPIRWVVNHAADEQTLKAAAEATLGPRAEGADAVRSWPFEVFAGVNQVWPDAHRFAVYLLRLP